MLTRKSASASTCLRCQLRFVLQSGQWRHARVHERRLLRPSPPFVAQKASFSITSWNRDDTERPINHTSTTATANKPQTSQDEEPYVKTRPRSSPARVRIINGTTAERVINPHRIIKGHKNYLREDRSDLGMKSLGRKSDVLILRDAGIETEESFPEEDAELEDEDIGEAGQSKERPLTKDVLAGIEKARNKLDLDEAFLAIEGMRLPQGVPISEDVYNEKVQELDQGFTANQLLHYFKNATRMNDMGKEARVTERDTASKIPRNWFPQIIRPWAHETEVFHGIRIDNRLKYKKAVIEQIMGTVWGIESESAPDTIGTLVVRLPAWLIKFLQLGQPFSTFDRIRKARQARISWVKHYFTEEESRKLEITADKMSAEAAVRDIDVAIRNMHRLTLPFVVHDRRSKTKLASPPGLAIMSGSKVSFEELEKLYDTCIFQTPTGLNIAGLDEESILDCKRAIVATRMLVEGNVKHHVYTDGDAFQNELFLSNFTLSDSLPLRQKKNSLKRVVAEVQKEERSKASWETTENEPPNESDAAFKDKGQSDPDVESKNDKTPLIAKNTLRKFFDDNIVKAHIPETKQDENSYWNHEPIHELYVTPGYHLVNQRDSSKNKRKKKAPAEDLSPNERVHTLTGVSAFDYSQTRDAENSPMFWPGATHGIGRVLTHLTPVSSASELFSQSTQSGTVVPTQLSRAQLERRLVFTLVPQTWGTNENSTRRYSNLELEFLIQDTNSMDPQGTRPILHRFAAIDEHTLTVPIPTQSIDTRFTHRIAYAIKPSMITLNPELNAFVNSTITSITGHGTIRAPETVKIKLPKWMSMKERNSFKKRTAIDKGKTWKTEEPKTDEESEDANPANASPSDSSSDIELEYYFLAVSSTETIPARFHDHDITYSFTEAGRIGGRYGELRLRYPYEEIEALAGQKVNRRRKQMAFIDAVLALNGLFDEAARGRLPYLANKETKTGQTNHNFNVGDEDGEDEVDSDVREYDAGGLRVREILAEPGKGNGPVRLEDFDEAEEVKEIASGSGSRT